MNLRSTTVLLDKTPDYSAHALAETFDRLLFPCLSLDDLTGSRILLKPNLISARMGKLACTDGAFILAAAKWFVERNATVVVGDSPAFGTATGILKKIGILADLRRLSVQISDFNSLETVTLSSGIRVGMATDALNCDLLVNMPRVKAHAQLRATLAVKNLFGCVGGMRKPLWHMVHGGKGGNFTGHIVELLSVLPDSITLVDGIIAMHRTGPIGGDPFPLGVTACGKNPVAVDSALLALLRIPPVASPLMVSCVKKGLYGTDVDSLNFPLYAPDQCAVDSFAVPDMLHPVRFNPFRFIKGSLKRMILKLIPSS